MMRSLAAACVLTAACGSVCAQGYIVGLPTNFDIFALSADGGVAVGSNTQRKGVIWSRGGGVEIIEPPAGFNTVRFLGVSGDGLTLCGHVSNAFTGGDQVAVRYNRLTGYEFLEDLGPPGERRAAAGEAISRDGSTVVGTGRDPSARAVRWRNSPVPEVLAPDQERSLAMAGTAVNADGTRIAGFGAANGFWWSEESGLVVLPADSNGYPLIPGAISDDGLVVGGGIHAWRWTPTDGYAPLPLLPDGQRAGSVYAMSADGSIMAGGKPTDGSPGSKAFCWTAASGTQYVHEVLAAQGVDVSDWTLRSVMGISADGRMFFGEGRHRTQGDGVWYVFIPEPLPAPGAVVVFGLAGVVVARRRR